MRLLFLLLITLNLCCGSIGGGYGGYSSFYDLYKVDPNVEVLESDSLAAVLWRISGMSQCPTGPSNMYILLSLQVFIFDLTVSLIVLPFNMVLWVLDCVIQAVCFLFNGIQTIIDALSQIYTQAKPFFRLFDGVFNFFSHVFRSLGSFLSNCFRTVGTAVTKILSVAGDIIHSVVTFLWEYLLMPIGKACSATWKFVVSLCQPPITFIWNSIILEIYNSIVHGLLAVVDILKVAANHITKTIIEGVQEVISELYAPIHYIFFENKIAGSTKAVLNNITENSLIYDYILNPLWCAVKQFVALLDSSSKFLWNSVFRQLVSWFQNGLESIINVLQNVVCNIVPAMTDYIIIPIYNFIGHILDGLQQYILWPASNCIKFTAGTAYDYVVSPLTKTLTWLGRAWIDYICSPLCYAVKEYIVLPIVNTLRSIGELTDYVLRSIGELLSSVTTPIGKFVYNNLSLLLKWIWDFIFATLRMALDIIVWIYDSLEILVFPEVPSIRSKDFSLGIYPSVQQQRADDHFILEKNKPFLVKLKNLHPFLRANCELSINGKVVGIFRLDAASSYSIKKPAGSGNNSDTFEFDGNQMNVTAKFFQEDKNGSFGNCMGEDTYNYNRQHNPQQHSNTNNNPASCIRVVEKNAVVIQAKLQEPN